MIYPPREETNLFDHSSYQRTDMLMNYLVVLQGLMVVRSMSNTNRSSFALSIEKTPLPSPSLFLSRIRTRHHHCHSTLLLQRLFHGHPQRVSHRDGTSSSNATISPMIQHANTSVDHLRRRRHASRERVIDDGENANVYGDDDGKRLRIQPEEIAEHRRDFKGEDDLPLARRFNSSKWLCAFLLRLGYSILTHSLEDELYDDDIDHARSDLREPDRRLMQVFVLLPVPQRSFEYVCFVSARTMKNPIDSSLTRTDSIRHAILTSKT